MNYDPDGRVGISLTLLILATLALFVVGAILSDPGFQRSLNDAVLSLGSGIKSACEALVKAINDALKKAKKRKKDNKYDNHHIVAWSAWQAAPSRDILNGVGINPKTNGLNIVRIKRNLHLYFNNNTAYYAAVNNLLKPAKGSYSKTTKVLLLIKSALLAASTASP